jgi:hypothetical protein
MLVRLRRVQKWLTRAGPYRVEHMPMPHPGRATDLSKREGVLHTIEGSLESGLSVFRVHFSPTFTVGRDRNGKVRIIQHIPLGMMAAALQNLPGGVETNFEAEVQVEIAAHSKTVPWLPEPGTTDALAELMAVLARVVNIPLTHPFPENPGPLPWATTRYAHRLAGIWGKVAGWYAHMDMPENTHWDCGWLKWDMLLALARHKARVDDKDGKLGAEDWRFGRWYLGLGEFAKVGRRSKRHRPVGYPQRVPQAGWNAVCWYQKHVSSRKRLTDTVRTRSLMSAAKSVAPALLCAGPETEGTD